MKESGENYLETILVLEREKGTLRSIDIARKLDYSKPSVSRAIKLLGNSGYITVDAEGFIKLTSKGRETAEGIYEKHRTLTNFFIKTANVLPEIAEEDACRIEHVISDETFQGIREYMNKNL